MSGAKEKEEGGERGKQKERKIDVEEGLAIESDAESNSGLIIDEPPTETAKDIAASEQALQSPSADPSPTQFATGAEAPIEELGEEEQMEMEAAMDLNLRRPES